MNRRRVRALTAPAVLESEIGHRPWALFLDFDGTLAPIVDRPERVAVLPGVRELVAELAKDHPVAVVSGRDREDVRARLGTPGLIYAGCHGLDIAGPGLDELVPAVDPALPALRRAEALLRSGCESISGAQIETKRYSVAVHYRRVSAASQVDRVYQLVDSTLSQLPDLRLRTGKKVLELVPDIDWDKGAAVRWIAKALGVDDGETVLIYIGDDDTDEDAFARLRRRDLGIRVGSAEVETQARYRIADPSAVRDILMWLCQRARARPGAGIRDPLVIPKC